MNLSPHYFDKAIDHFVSGGRQFCSRVDLRIAGNNHYLRLVFTLDDQMLSTLIAMVFQFNCRGIIE